MDHLKLQKQVATLGQWRDHIDTARARLAHAANNATSAVALWQQYAAEASPDELAATGATVAAELSATEQADLAAIATLVSTFAAATGQSTAALVAKLSTALGN